MFDVTSKKKFYMAYHCFQCSSNIRVPWNQAGKQRRFEGCSAFLAEGCSQLLKACGQSGKVLESMTKVLVAAMSKEFAVDVDQSENTTTEQE